MRFIDLIIIFLILSFLLIVCSRSPSLSEVDKSLVSKYEGPLIAAEEWIIEYGEIEKLRLGNIISLEYAKTREIGVLIYSNNKMIGFSAEDYYRVLKERPNNPGIFWTGKGVRGLNVMIVEMGNQGKAYIANVDIITGKAK